MCSYLSSAFFVNFLSIMKKTFFLLIKGIPGVGNALFLNFKWLCQVSVCIHLSYKFNVVQPCIVLSTIVTKELLKYLFSLLVQYTLIY